MQISYDTVYRAYRRARKSKGSNKQIQERSSHEEKNLKQLHYELQHDIYTIGKPHRYIIKDKVYREIITLPFRDRIVQHIVHEALYPLVERQAIYDVYNNMIGKGTLFGVKRVSRFMRSCSDNYTKDVYVMRLDIQSFFLSIHKDTLYRQTIDLITKYVRLYDHDWDAMSKLIYQIIYYDYRHYTDRTDYMLHKKFPLHKSIQFTDGKKGLPLGNLTSQLFANIYMQPFDVYIKHQLKISYYGRYVDDFVLMHNNKDYLIYVLDKCKLFLSSKLQLTLHPNKIYLQHYKKGVKFLGIVIYPYHRTIAKITIGKVYQKFRYNTTYQDMYRSLMSYYGLAMHHNNYRVVKNRIGHFSEM